MATGQLLRDATGKLLRDANGKIKRWVVTDDVVDAGELADYSWSVSESHHETGLNETAWDAAAAGVLIKSALSRYYWVAQRRIEAYWSHHNAWSPTTGETAVRSYQALRFDVSAYDEDRLKLWLKVNTTTNYWLAFDTNGDLKSSVNLRFVYELSNTAQLSYAIDTDGLEALTTLATYSMADIDAFGGDYFGMSLPDTEGYDFLLVGVVLEWMLNGTIPKAYDALNYTNPRISAKFWCAGLLIL